jgi:hypothetical protein
MENIDIRYSSSVLASSTWAIVDGTGKTIFTGEANGGNSNPTAGEGGQATTEILNFNDIRVRFQNGLNLVIVSTTGTVQTYTVNLLFRTP